MPIPAVAAALAGAGEAALAKAGEAALAKAGEAALPKAGEYVPVGKEIAQVFASEALPSRSRVTDVLAANPRLATEFKTALSSGDARRIAQVRGKITEGVVAKVLAPHVTEGNFLAQVASPDAAGVLRRADLTGTAAENLALGGREFIAKGQRFGIEIKTGGERYLSNEFKAGGHIEKQVEAMRNANPESTPFVVVSRDFKDLPPHMQAEIRTRLKTDHGAMVVAALPKAAQLDKRLGRIV